MQDKCHQAHDNDPYFSPSIATLFRRLVKILNLIIIPTWTIPNITFQTTARTNNLTNVNI